MIDELVEVRLACLFCDREDCDGVAPTLIPVLLAGGWSGIEKVYDLGGSDWWTHLGVCPDCNAAGCND